jgi:hypothetical protein
MSDSIKSLLEVLQKENLLNKPELKNKDYLKEWKQSCKIDVTETIPPPQTAIEINGEIFGTLGNFSLITGKAKAKKSFFISMAVSTAVSSDTLHGILKNKLPSDKKEVLYFDTEQGKYHVQMAVKRICEQIKVSNPENLHAYFLRSKSPAERLEFIEYLIYEMPNVGVVFIDGIKDLITSINDESEASMITTKLMKWTEERNIHLVTVLHQNKGDNNNARGHIGTELTNKAETVGTVTVVEGDKSISSVEASSCRNKEFEPFSFSIDENGIPFVLEAYEQPIKKDKRTDKVEHWRQIDDTVRREVVEKTFEGNESIIYEKLWRALKEVFQQRTGIKINDNQCKQFVTNLKIDGLIYQIKERTPYFLAKDFTENSSDVMKNIEDFQEQSENIF